MQTTTTTVTAPATANAPATAPVTPAQGQQALQQATGTTPAQQAPSKATKGNGKAPKANGPKVANGATLTGIAGTKGEPVTAAQLWAFVNTKAGGNYSAVQIVPLANVNPNAASPIPFTNMQKQGNRAAIFWAIVKGVPVPNGKPSRTLASYLAHSLKHGASSKNPLDLLAALNGGFSTSSKTWGTPYVKLVVTGSNT